MQSLVFIFRSANWRMLFIALIVVTTITMALVALAAPHLPGLSYPLSVAANWNSNPLPLDVIP